MRCKNIISWIFKLKIPKFVGGNAFYNALIKRFFLSTLRVSMVKVFCPQGWFSYLKLTRIAININTVPYKNLKQNGVFTKMYHSISLWMTNSSHTTDKIWHLQHSWLLLILTFHLISEEKSYKYGKLENYECLISITRQTIYVICNTREYSTHVYSEE